MLFWVILFYVVLHSVLLCYYGGTSLITFNLQQVKMYCIRLLQLMLNLICIYVVSCVTSSYIFIVKQLKTVKCYYCVRHIIIIITIIVDVVDVVVIVVIVIIAVVVAASAVCQMSILLVYVHFSCI